MATENQSVDRDHLLAKIQELNVWRRGSERAPHKPLLLLLALGRLRQGSPRLLNFADIQQPLSDLLEDFGPPRRSPHPEYPFWRLRNDGLWEVKESGGLHESRAKGDSSRRELLDFEAKGGFPVPIFRMLQKDPKLVDQIAEELLASHFPSSLHEEILDTVGLRLQARPRPALAIRPSAFRFSMPTDMLVFSVATVFDSIVRTLGWKRLIFSGAKQGDQTRPLLSGYKSSNVSWLERWGVSALEAAR